MKEKQTDNISQEARTDLSGEVLAVKRVLGGKSEKLLYGVGILCSLFHLWVNTIGIMPEIQRNAVHYGFMLFMGVITSYSIHYTKLYE